MTSMVNFMTTLKWSKKMKLGQMDCNFVKMYILTKKIYYISHKFWYDHCGHFYDHSISKSYNDKNISSFCFQWPQMKELKCSVVVLNDYRSQLTMTSMVIFMTIWKMTRENYLRWKITGRGLECKKWLKFIKNLDMTIVVIFMTTKNIKHLKFLILTFIWLKWPPY